MRFRICPIIMSLVFCAATCLLANSTAVAAEPPDAAMVNQQEDDASEGADITSRTLSDFEAISEANRANRSEEELSASLGVSAYSLSRNGLILSGVEQLTVEEARTLAKYTGFLIGLPDIESLTPEAAAALAQWESVRGVGVLVLNGLESLGPDAARHLATLQRVILKLDGLRDLDADTAAELGKCSGCSSLAVNGITELESATAEALANQPVSPFYKLELNGVESLDAESAAALGRFSGSKLMLNGVKSLNASSAAGLAQFQGNELRLDGLEKLSADAARALSEWGGSRLGLNGLRTLDRGSAAGLALWRGQTLELSGIERIDADVGAALARFESQSYQVVCMVYSGRQQLVMNGVRTLDVNAAAALGSGDGLRLSLSGLESLDAETARALVEGEGNIRQLTLMGLESIDADTAAVLAGFGWRLSVSDKIQQLIDEGTSE